MKKIKGITLIALIITIIVLLILAGVTIATLMGDNGLIIKAKDAKIATEIASIKEEIQTKILENQAENNGNITDDKLNEIIAKYDKDNKIRDNKEESYIITEKGYEIKISDIFNGTPIENEPLKPYVLAETIRGANSPDISGFNVENTHYVTWGEVAPYQRNELNQTNTIDKEPPTGWSNYTEKKWANIITNGGGNECYWVWIPRYAYKITYTAEDRSSGTIDVVFLKGQTNNDMNGKDVTSSSYVDSKGQTGAYKVHPAFTTIGNGQAITNSDGSVNTNYVGNGGFGELTGIWVAKFEASSSSVSETTVNTDLNGVGGGQNINLQVRVKPNVTSWRGIKVNDIFKVCQNLVEPNNSLCSTNNTKNTKLDSHMMKNTEWGAIAYLSMSVYGKNGEVWNNPYYNNETNLSPITGLCSKETDGKDKAYTATDITKTCKYNEVGGNASTTGNVYGVYDMAGGAWEYVAGIYKGGVSDDNRSKLWDSNNSKYVDQYIVTTDSTLNSQTDYYGNTNKYGDAVYETSSSGNSSTGSWDSSYSLFPVSSSPVFVRGGHALSGSYAGVFAFTLYTGEANTDISFRPVVLSSQ